MTEFEGRPNYLVQEADELRVKRLSRIVGEMVADQRSTDPVETAFLRAVQPELSTEGRLSPHLEELFAFKRTRGHHYPDGYALRTLEFAVDKQVRQRVPGNIYPQFFLTTGAYKYYDIFGTLDYHDLFSDMQENLRSNIQLGYEIFKLMSFAFRERWGEKPTVVDTGVSLGLGLKKWEMHKTHPFKPIRTLLPPRRGQPITPDLDPDHRSQDLINYLVTQEPIFGQAIGYDNFPLIPDQPEAIEMVFSHTFPMSESLRDPEGVREFEDLVETSPKNVHLIQRNIDATNPQSLKQLKEVLPGGKADIFTFSAVLFEMAPSEVSKVLDNLKEYCNPGALYFVSDFARVNSGAPNGFDFIRGDWWHRLGSFASFVIDPFRPQEAPIEICRFLTRRCDEMWLSEAGKKLFNEAVI